MHELSLANEICNIVEREVSQGSGLAALSQVTVVCVEIGEQANVERNSLQFCLDALLGAHPFGQGRAELVTVSGDDLQVAWFELDDLAPTFDPAAAGSNP